MMFVKLLQSLLCSLVTQTTQVKQTFQSGTSHTSNTQKVFVPPDFCYPEHCHTSMGEVGYYNKCLTIIDHKDQVLTQLHAAEYKRSSVHLFHRQLFDCGR